MMYNDVDTDLPPFTDTIDGEEIFLFSNGKTSSNGASFLHDDDVVASTSSHLSVDVDELLLNGNFLEQQSEDPLFWNCKDIADTHLNNNNNNEQSQQQQHPQQQHSNIESVQNQCNLRLTTSTSQSQQTIQQHSNSDGVQNGLIRLSQQQQHQQQQQQLPSSINLQNGHLRLTQQLPQQIQQQLPNLDSIHNGQLRLSLSQQPQQQQQQLQVQQHSIPDIVQALQQQPQVTTLHTSQIQPPTSNQTTAFSTNQQWVTLVHTNDQYQTYATTTQPQYFISSQPIIQTTISPPFHQPQSEQKPKITSPSENNNNINNNNAKKESSVKQKPKEKQTRLDCPYCKRSFSKNFDLQQHMRCHTGEKPFQCIVCGRGFAQKSNVKKHMQAHKVWPEGPNNPPIPTNQARGRNINISDQCAQENESSRINSVHGNNNGITHGLSNDKRNDGSDIFAENRYSCSYCPFNGRTYFELKSHLTIHKREKVFKCIVSPCGKTFCGSDLQGFLDHVTGHKDLIYHCHLCSGQFYSLDEFGEHQKHHSSSSQVKRTSQTQNQTQQSSVMVLNQQSNTSLRQQNQQVTINQLQPQQNQRQYNQQNNQKSAQLYNSQPPKNNQKYFRCSKCMNRYTTQTALDHHLSISTHNFPCTECNKVFMCERYLRRHLNTHTTVQHVCTYCDKQFKTAAYLKMHSVVHTGEKPFRCNLCEAAFNRRDKLNRHKLTHETVKKYKCPYKPLKGCTKEFNRPDKLKAHVLTHSGVRPHPCDACSRTFSRLSRLREHKKLHHDANNNNTTASNLDVKPKVVETAQPKRDESPPQQQQTFLVKTIEVTSTETPDNGSPQDQIMSEVVDSVA